MAVIMAFYNNNPYIKSKKQAEAELDFAKAEVWAKLGNKGPSYS